MQEALATALRRLSPHDRQAIALRYFEGLNNQEAAAVLGINHDTFQTHPRRARNRPRKFIPAPVAALVSGTVGVPAVLAARPPALPAARLRELAAGMWAKAAAPGWTMGKTAAVVGASSSPAVSAPAVGR